MAISPLAVTVTAPTAEFNTALQAAIDDLTITTWYGISISVQGGNTTGTFVYA